MRRLDAANELFNHQNYYPALQRIKRAIIMLDGATKDKQVQEWVKKIEAVDHIRGEGATKETRQWNQNKLRQMASFTLYEQIEPMLWAKLHDEEYTINKNSFEFYDPSDDRPSP